MKEANILVDSSIKVDIGNVIIEETNDISINTKVDVGKVDIKKNNEEAFNKLDIEVNVGKITVLAKEEEKKEND